MPPRKRPAAAASRRPAAKSRTRVDKASVSASVNIYDIEEQVWLKMGPDSAILWESDDGSEDDKTLVCAGSSHDKLPPDGLVDLLSRGCRCSARCCFQQFQHCTAGVHLERERFRALKHSEKAQSISFVFVTNYDTYLGSSHV